MQLSVTKLSSATQTWSLTMVIQQWLRFFSSASIYWCSQTTQVQTSVPQTEALNSVLPLLSRIWLIKKGGGDLFILLRTYRLEGGKKSTMSSGWLSLLCCHFQCVCILYVSVPEAGGGGVCF